MLSAQVPTWSRKDNRNEEYTVQENEIVIVDLQATGYEPMMIYNDGSDLSFAYNRGGPWFPMPDGYTYTWEWKHPFNSEFYLTNDTAVTSTVSFAIGGSLYGPN